MREAARARCPWWAVGALFVALSMAAPPASADRSRQVVAQEGHPSSVSAHGGRLVWSSFDRAADRFRLVQHFRGRIELLPVAARRQPFDVDLGPDQRGRTVAVYSRCRREAVAPLRGCDLFRYDFAARRETEIHRISSAGASERWPAIWGRRIAFVRERPFGRFGTRVHPSVLVWEPGKRPRRVPGGPRAESEYVGDLELRGRSLAYVWTAAQSRRARTSAFAARDVTTLVRVITLRARRQTVERLRYDTFGPQFFGTSLSQRWLYYGYDDGRDSRLRRYRLSDGKRERTRAPEPLVSAEWAPGGYHFLIGEDRRAESGQPCSIGVTDVIIAPSRPRLCTVGTLRGARFR